MFVPPLVNYSTWSWKQSVCIDIKSAQSCMVGGEIDIIVEARTKDIMRQYVREEKAHVCCAPAFLILIGCLLLVERIGCFPYLGDWPQKSYTFKSQIWMAETFKNLSACKNVPLPFLHLLWVRLSVWHIYANKCIYAFIYFIWGKWSLFYPLFYHWYLASRYLINFYRMNKWIKFLEVFQKYRAHSYFYLNI